VVMPGLTPAPMKAWLKRATLFRPSRPVRGWKSRVRKRSPIARSLSMLTRSVNLLLRWQRMPMANIC